MPSLQLASVIVQFVDVLLGGHTGALFQQLRYCLEHVFDERPMPRLQPSMGVDLMPALQSVVIARQLVRTNPASALTARRAKRAFARASVSERLAPRA